MSDEPLLLGYADVPVPDFTLNRQGTWAYGLNLETSEDRSKLERIIRRYFEVTTNAIRRYDQNHLIFGPRFNRPSGKPPTPDWIIKIAGEYFDVILVNLFVRPEEITTDMKRWHKLSGRPILLADMAYRAPTELLKVSPKSKMYVPNQKAQGEAYQFLAKNVMRAPYMLGLHWCSFMENRTRKAGIKNYLDEPYWECVRLMQEFNVNQLYKTALSK